MLRRLWLAMSATFAWADSSSTGDSGDNESSSSSVAVTPIVLGVFFGLAIVITVMCICCTRDPTYSTGSTTVTYKRVPKK